MSTAQRLHRKQRAGQFLLGLLVMSAAAGVMWFQRLDRYDEPQAPAVMPENDAGAAMVTRDFRHVETRLDRTVWILEAARAEVFEESARLHTVKITWYGEPGSLPVVVTCADGEVNFRKRSALLNGAVRVERADGAVLLTERLLWDERRKHLRAPHPVVITTPGFTFRGERFDANLGTEQFLLHGGVQGEVRVGTALGARPS